MAFEIGSAKAPCRNLLETDHMLALPKRGEEMLRWLAYLGGSVLLGAFILSAFGVFQPGNPPDHLINTEQRQSYLITTWIIKIVYAGIVGFISIKVIEWVMSFGSTSQDAATDSRSPHDEISELNGLDVDEIAPPSVPVTVREASRQLGVTESTVYRRLDRGVLQGEIGPDGRRMVLISTTAMLPREGSQSVDEGDLRSKFPRPGPVVASVISGLVVAVILGGWALLVNAIGYGLNAKPFYMMVVTAGIGGILTNIVAFCIIFRLKKRRKLVIFLVFLFVQFLGWNIIAYILLRWDIKQVNASDQDGMLGVLTVILLLLFMRLSIVSILKLWPH